MQMITKRRSVRGLERIRRASQRLRRHYFTPAAVILMYHRIVDLAVDPYGIVVSPSHFAQHLEYIRQTCHPMRLLDLIEAMRNHSLPKRAVVLTFDDGYADFFSIANPLLAGAQIPATVFVASGYTDSQQCFWSDELTRVLLLSERLPSSLRLSVRGVDYRWALTSPGERQVAHSAIYDLLLPLPPAEQSSVLECLKSWAGIANSGCAEDRAMTSTELIQLAQSGLVELGAHTVNHPVLSALSGDDQCAEIVECRRKLESVIGSPILTFAYPHGTLKDFTDETARHVEAAGFCAACTTIPGVVDPSSDLYRLRRCWVGNWDYNTFRKNLEWYLLQ